MKKQNIAGTVFKALLLGSVLVGCQQEETLAPEAAATQRSDESGKLSAELKLVKDGQNTIQYVKSGRYTGRISKVSGPYTYTTYAYIDGATTSEYTIATKQYLKSNNTLVDETNYYVVNGLCQQSQHFTDNYLLNYQYNEVGRLDQMSYVGNSTKIKFSYLYDSAAGVERLNKMTFTNNNGNYREIAFSYSIGMNPPKQDKYSLNHEHTGLDKYLPIFGKFSDQLVQQVVITPLPYTNQSKPYYKYFYGLNNDGYAISVQRHFFPLGYGYEAGKEVSFSALDYSTGWQGI